MLSFKKKKNKNTSNHIRGFKDNFSGNQKKSIMSSLYILANSDGEFHRTEANYFNSIASALGFNLGKNDLTKFMSKGTEQIFQILASLDDVQKDWYIVTAYAMLHADGEALDVEYQYLEVYFEKMEITREHFENVINTSHKLLNEIVTY